MNNFVNIAILLEKVWILFDRDSHRSYIKMFILFEMLFKPDELIGSDLFGSKDGRKFWFISMLTSFEQAKNLDLNKLAKVVINLFKDYSYKIVNNKNN